MSRRMGRSKALLPLAGKPMICRVVETCNASGCCSEIIVVTGHESSKIEEVLATFAVNLVHNSEFEAGEMLSSVQAGVRALPDDCKAFFLLPGDQPLVQPFTFVALARSFQEADASLALPVYEGKRGHPVLISAHLIPEILALGGGDTLKTALTRHRDPTAEIAVADSGVVSDIDTPEDFEAAALTIEGRNVWNRSSLAP